MNEKTKMNPLKIALIGCGNIGKAFAERLSIDQSLLLYDSHKPKAEQLDKEGFGKAAPTLEEAIHQSDIVILAIKQKDLESVASSPAFKNFKGMIISLLSGTRLERLKELFPTERVVRMMPNLAVLYGEGLLGLASDSELTEKEAREVTEICRPLGQSLWITEDKFNAFTAIAGSGPAFIFSLVEAIVESGIAMGFNAEESQTLVYQMMKGSIHLLMESGKHPGELKWQVSSPQGTTIAGLQKLEAAAIHGGLMSTFMAAYERANQLST